jgi:hypothetical protein
VVLVTEFPALRAQLESLSAVLAFFAWKLAARWSLGLVSAALLAVERADDCECAATVRRRHRRA